MEKTIPIDGKQIPFKTNGATVKRYMMQFQRDYLQDLVKMGIDLITDKDLKDMSDKERLELVRKIDFNIFYDFAWTFAKTANPQIPDPLTWLDSFDTFPIIEILPELQDMLTAAISTKKK